MQDLWNYCKTRNWNEKKKIRCFLILNSLIFGLAGFFVWMAVRLFVCDSIVWMLCFIGYPVVILGIFGGSFFLMNQDHWRSAE